MKAQTIPPQVIGAFDAMLKTSHTKLIAPTLAYTVLELFLETGKQVFTAQEIRTRYRVAICELVSHVGHNLHQGAEFDTAYISREDRGIVRYGILRPIGDKQYQLAEPYAILARTLIEWIPSIVKSYIDTKLGSIGQLALPPERLLIAESVGGFLEFLQHQMDQPDGGVSFEIICFAILKVYLEKFACRIYRDTRTFSHEGGTDLSTDFGAVYQIKKLKITRPYQVDELYSEVKTNFDSDRIRDGRVVLVVDDISPECKSYLLQKNSLKYFRKVDLLEIASIINDVEDRQKALRIIYEEFCRENANENCARNGCDGIHCPVLNVKIR